MIPYIREEFNPNIINTLNRLSTLVKDQEEYFVDVIKEKFESLVIEENNEEIQLDLKKFNKEKKVIKSRLLLYTISRLFGNTKGIEKIHIEDLIKLCENNIGNKYLTPNKNLKVLIKNHKIYLKKQNAR